MSLRSLPHKNIWTDYKMNWCYGWVMSCVILHNLMIEFNDDWEAPPGVYEEIMQEIERENQMDEEVNNQRNAGEINEEVEGPGIKRTALVQIFLESEWAPMN